MNKITIDEEFLEEPLMKYDAGAIILESMIHIFSELTPEDSEEFRKFIEGNIGYLITFLKELLTDLSKEEFYTFPLYEILYGVFYHLKKEGFLSQEQIDCLGELIGLDEFPISINGIKKVQQEIVHYTTFYLENGNNPKGVLENKARQYYILKDYQSAINIGLEIINFHNGDYLDYLFVGNCFSHDGEHKKALRYYKKASYWHPDNKRKYNAQKGIYSHLGLNKYALETGHAYYELGEHDNALINYLGCKDPEEVGIKMFWNLGGKLCKEGKFNLAIKAFEKIIILDSTHYDALAYLGLCYYQTEKHKESVVYLQEALSVNRNKEQAYLNLHAAYVKMKDYDGAKNTLEELVDKFPDNPTHKEVLKLTIENIEKQQDGNAIEHKDEGYAIIGRIGDKNIVGNFG